MISMSFTMGQCEITGKPEVIPADPIRIITSGLPTIHSEPQCSPGARGTTVSSKRQLCSAETDEM
jgi:hypothetical protein